MDAALESFGLDLSAGGLRNTASARQVFVTLLKAAPDPPFFERLATRLLECLAECADPDMALGNLHRWLGQLGHSLAVQRMLVEDQFLLRHLLLLFSSSQYFADILCRDPAYYELLADPARLAQRRTAKEIAEAVARSVAPFRTYEGRLDALRRAKRREILRIGARDLFGLASFPEVVDELSAFADAAVAQAYRMAREEIERRFGSLDGLEFAVIAMGKLGGRELNYSSDIDLIFVYRGSEEHVASAARIGEHLIEALARPTAEGYLFRVDMRLRPEGQAGPLVRSLDAYRDYYEHHIEHWERQALLKARFVAGDETLGRDFHALIEPYVYRLDVPPSLIEELRLNKLRVEKRCEMAGERFTNVKDGWGGIRDIEFTVQLLQLLFGARVPEVRTGNTLEALDALARAGLLPAEECQRIREAYEFLRVVEHRLQIMDERAVRCLPLASEAVARLARRMPRMWHHDPGAEFTAEYRRHAGTVRGFHQRFFFDPFEREAATPSRLTALGELLLTLDSEDARARIRQYLVARGFLAPERALSDLDRLAGIGGPRAKAARLEDLALLARVGPQLLETAAMAPDLDAALSFVVEVALKGDREGLLTTLGESGFAREVMCRLGGTAPAATQPIRREPALLDMLFEPEAIASPADEHSLRERLAIRLARHEDHEARLNSLRRFKRREMLRIAAADVLAAVDIEGVVHQLTLLAEVCVGAAVDLSVDALRARGDLDGEPEFAVFGLGGVGGFEMLYPSDLDLLFVCDLPEGEARERCYLSYSRLAERIQDALTRLLPDGDLYPVDLRLRPEGQGGELAPSLDACRRYYAERAQTWERQALLKARFLAGDVRVAREFCEIIRPFAFPEDPSPEMADEVRAMKRRVEKERTDRTTRARDLKLGPGGMSDVEFLVQWLQLLHAGRHPALREPSTLAALPVLVSLGLLPEDEAGILREGYRFQMRLRNLLYLRFGRPVAVLPEGDEDQRALARALEMENAGELLEAFYAHRERVRAIFERRFYGDG
ncbi:MAG TPA: bifunctional [glutamine synthetase] adenylyltransferase/[glutamine synthetase]-adenylyl-L-tyrosine phosphorylase [Armatimonadota bacterium]|nr:bifunctional [glutamine synthetase] adenylyltransferase/[glutamine synthetase]-adenylyl-L-tyrosine phosphorylase [Armatimonadota bacterium]